MTDPGQLVDLATFARLEEAQLAQELLEREGIRAIVPDAGIVGANPLLVGAVGYLRLQVAEGDRVRALSVLAGVGMTGGGEAEASEDLEAEAMAAEADESARAFLRRKDGE